MSLPKSLVKTESAIAQELAEANIKLNFHITGYRQDTENVEYSLTSTQMPPECTVTQAKHIAERHLRKWKRAAKPA